MKTPRNKLPAQKALLLATAAPMVPNIAPEADAGEDEDQLVRTSDAAHKLGVCENTVRKYVKLGCWIRSDRDADSSHHGPQPGPPDGPTGGGIELRIRKFETRQGPKQPRCGRALQIWSFSGKYLAGMSATATGESRQGQPGPLHPEQERVTSHSWRLSSCCIMLPHPPVQSFTSITSPPAPPAASWAASLPARRSPSVPFSRLRPSTRNSTWSNRRSVKSPASSKSRGPPCIRPARCGPRSVPRRGGRASADRPARQGGRSLCAHGVPKASAVHIVEAIGVELALDIVDQLTSPVTVPAKVPATVPVPVKVPVVVPMKVPTVMEAAE